MNPAGLCTTNGAGSPRESANRLEGSARKSQNEPSPLFSIRGGMRPVWLLGSHNIQRRYLIYVASFNLPMLMRNLIGYGTPKKASAALELVLLRVHAHSVPGILFICLLTKD